MHALRARNFRSARSTNCCPTPGRYAGLIRDPADFYGIRDRGRIKPGLAADIVMFSEQGVSSRGRPERLYDLPGGAKRMVMRPRGVERTLVNGVVTWEGGKLTGANAGTVLRS